MKEDKPAVKSSTAKENEPVLENGKKKVKEEKPATKVVVRRLPPSMTEEQFKLQVAPLPDFDYFYFVAADKSLTPNAFSRAYINFIDQTDLFIFTQKFDGYVFLDSKGGEFPAVVEFAPFQRIPKNRPNRKKDPKVGTIEADPLYSAFKERVEAESLENRTANTSKQHFFETSLVPEKKEMSNTPLLDYIKNRRAERQRIRDEKRDEKRKKDLERRKAKEEQRRTKKEDETPLVKVLNNQNTSKERAKEKEIKQSFVKKKSDEVKPTVKEKSTTEARSKESKTRTGKSYLEERQRQAERREELRKKQFQNQSSNSPNESKSPAAEEKNTANEEKPSEEKVNVSDSKENKIKDSEFKKSERAFKRDETRRNSYKYDKYESKRDKESDETRKARRSNNDRSHQKREDEKSEDSGRKRYSESRKSHDSTQRDKYKDKSKSYGQKRASTTDLGKVKNSIDVQSKASDENEVKTEEKLPKVEESQMKKENELPKRVHSNSLSDVKETKVEDNELTSEIESKSTTFLPKDKTKPTRRKSLDYDKNRSTSSSTNNSIKSYSRDKYSEKKRRNSVGSAKSNNESIEVKSPQEKPFTNNTKDLFVKKLTSKDKLLKEDKPSGEFKSRVPESKDSEKDHKIFEERDLPRRRNSTGQRQVSEKSAIRRNSLGSEEKKEEFVFKEQKFDSEVISEEDKPKDEKKTQRFSRDPRSERRIRNKDRPSIEIYRPGMGKFSKQRLEREKGGLGSSTEVESPSSSPSPTPVFKHKIVSAQH